MPTTTASPASILARALRPFAGRTREGILHHALRRCDGATLSVTATDLSVAGIVSIAAPADHPTGAAIVATASGEPVTDRSPDDFPAVGSLDGAIVATIRTTLSEIERIAAHVVPATDDESSRYALGGVLLDCVGDGGPAHAVATDGRRMHVARFACSATDAATAIVPPRLFPGIVAAARAAARAGGRGRVSPDDTVTLTITTQAVEAAWHDDLSGALARVVARRIEGRFPAWRRVVEIDADATPCDAPAALGEWCAEVVTATAAARKAAGEAAADALPAGATDARRRAVRAAAETAHPHGVQLTRTEGAAGRGCALTFGAVRCPWTIALDATYAAQAIAGAVAWNDAPRATIRATDSHRAAWVASDSWHLRGGSAFLAVVMPLAQD